MLFYMWPGDRPWCMNCHLHNTSHFPATEDWSQQNLCQVESRIFLYIIPPLITTGQTREEISQFLPWEIRNQERETDPTSPGVEMTVSGHTFCSLDWRILYVNKWGRMKLTYEEKLETVQVEGPHASCSWGPSCVLRVLWGRRPSILTTITLSTLSESEWLSSFAIEQVLIYHICMDTMKTWWHAVSLFKRERAPMSHGSQSKNQADSSMSTCTVIGSSKKFKFTSKIKRESETQIRRKHM